jgi:hypothetical protein
MRPPNAHRVFQITDGANDDWASWYAEWLVRLSELPGPLGGTLVRSELIYLLVRLDKEYTSAAPSSAGKTRPMSCWPTFGWVELAATRAGR